MSLESARATFAHAAKQDVDDALYVLWEGLEELCDEIEDLRKRVAELGARDGATPATPPSAP